MKPQSPTPLPRETAFEKQRGVSNVETRGGYSLVHVSQIGQRLMEERLRVLGLVAEAGVSIDFLKLTPSGMSFLAPMDQAELLQSVLADCGVHFSVRSGRSVVTVYAVNIRDEEGLIAEIVQGAIASGATIDHIGDGHDRLLIVANDEDAQRMAQGLRNTLLARSA